MKLIVGLGNPGKEYRQSRHNIGREFVMDLALTSAEEQMRWKSKFDSIILETTVHKEKILFALPETFMNLSGQAVAKIVNFYHLSAESVLVVHDEMDFAPGIFAYGKNGGSAGHNGIASIMEYVE